MKAYIKAIGYYLPEKIITNEDLIKDFPEWSVEKVSSKTGISTRHISAAGETATDMAEKAAKILFAEHSISSTDIDFILFCTQSPDYKLPTSACILQKRLNIPSSCGAFDYNLGCSGYIYGLSLAKGLLVSGIAKNILLLTSETYSKYIHPSDKGNRSIFGDAATATLISDAGFARLEDAVLGTNGEGAGNLIVKTSGARFPDEAAGAGENSISGDYLYMDGPAIFNFTLDTVPSLISETLKKNDMKYDDIHLFILHQANKFMLDTIRKVCGIPKDKFYVNLDKVGNTVSSTIPIAICEARKENLLSGNILLAGFGVGYSWGGIVIKII